MEADDWPLKGTAARKGKDGCLFSQDDTLSPLGKLHPFLKVLKSHDYTVQCIYGESLKIKMSLVTKGMS